MTNSPKTPTKTRSVRNPEVRRQRTQSRLLAGRGFSQPNFDVGDPLVTPTRRPIAINPEIRRQQTRSRQQEGSSPHVAQRLNFDDVSNLFTEVNTPPRRRGVNSTWPIRGHKNRLRLF